MNKLTIKEIMKKIDKMNKDRFEYVGVLYPVSGFRPLIERIQKFIEDFGAEPIEKIEVEPEITNPEILKHFIVINVGKEMFNIYRVKDVKHKIQGLTKDKCFIRLMGED